MSALLKEEMRTETLLDVTLELKGVRESDDFIINIFQQNKKYYKLNRFRYTIKSADKFHFDFIKSIIYLPYFYKDNCEFELVLINSTKNMNNYASGRYVLRSLSKVPFRINGVWSFEAFVERGDIVDIGFNKIQFPTNSNIVEYDLLELVPKEIIESNLNIVIQGETGTGKTMLARKIHDASGVAGEFVHLNLSSFSPTLLESELFGHVKGAFTGAFTNKNGAFIQANRGTLFLDEIDSLPKAVQTKLLLFLENFEVRPVRGEISQKVQVRLIFASGRDLKKLVSEQMIRSDFYYRLMSGYELKLKSLAENKAAIKVFCKKFEKDEMVILNEDLITYYEKMNWPGNVRQLKSHLTKKKLFAQGKKIVFNSLDEALLSEETTEINNFSFQSLEHVKYEYCMNAYFKMNNNIKKTAKVLQISENTLRVILKRCEKLRTKKEVNVNV
jgi:hypothetical protein